MLEDSFFVESVVNIQICLVLLNETGIPSTPRYADDAPRSSNPPESFLNVPIPHNVRMDLYIN